MRLEDNREHYDYNEEMCFVASNCRKFKRRRNVNSFNMTDYRACDNCVNYTPDRRCTANSTESMLFGRDVW